MSACASAFSTSVSNVFLQSSSELKELTVRSALPYESLVSPLDRQTTSKAVWTLSFQGNSLVSTLIPRLAQRIRCLRGHYSPGKELETIDFNATTLSLNKRLGQAHNQHFDRPPTFASQKE